MLLLDRPKATLTGFHRFNPNIGQGTDRFNKMSDDWRVNSYKNYLESIGSLREYTNGYASHWSDLAHVAHWNVDNDDLQMRLNAEKPKVKKPNIQAWLKQNHPEILKQFKNAA